MRIGLEHVHLFASDLDATVAFFRTMFGATPVWDHDAAGARNVRLALGNAFLQLYDQPPKRPRGGAMHHVGIATDDLDALVGHMSSQGYAFRNPVRDAGDFRYVMVSGPDDLLIELFECREPARWGMAPAP
jgi:catechol 2,3-dioxygenase-like lactoylglutathione lyase family enzyme